MDIVEQHPAVLRGGEIVTVDAAAIVSSGRRSIAVGRTNVWPAHYQDGQGTVQRDSVIGILRDSAGNLTAVPSPLPGQQVLYPRAAPAPDGNWHVVFVTGKEGTPDDILAFATAKVWYGLFDGKSWSGLTQLDTVTFARLNTQMSSRLVAAGDDLSMAFPFGTSTVRTKDGHTLGGLVMIKRRAGQWSFDTLTTPFPPAYTDITAGVDSSHVQVALSLDYFENRHSYPATLFVSDYGTTWGKLWRVSGDTTQSVQVPALFHVGRQTIAGWIDSRLGGGTDSFRVSAAPVVFGRRDSAFVITTARGWSAFGAVPFGDDRLIWIIPDRTEPPGVRVLSSTHDSVEGIGTIAGTFSNLVPTVGLLPDSTIMVMTGIIDRSANPPAWSVVTRFRLVCGKSP